MIERYSGALEVMVPMTLAQADTLLAAGQAVLREPLEIIDLSRVTVADSSALSVLLGWLRAAKASGRQLRFVGVPANLRALADLYGLDEVLPLA